MRAAHLGTFRAFDRLQETMVRAMMPLVSAKDPARKPELIRRAFRGETPALPLRVKFAEVAR